MPFEPVDPLGGFIGTQPFPDAPDVNESPDFINEVIPAAFRTENIIGSFLNDSSRAFSDAAYDPELDVGSEIIGTKYETFLDDFAEVRNRAHLEAIKADIDRELSDRETLAQAGVPGMVAMMGAGFFDLPTLLPGAAAIRTARGGVSVLKTAGVTAGLGALEAGVSEVALQATQETRTAAETGFAIAGSAVLAGILGGAIGATLKKTDAASIAEKLDRDFIIPGDSEADVFMPGAVRAPAGAAHTQEGAENALKSAFGFEKAFAHQDPLLRTQVLGAEPTRRISQELSESPLTLTKNAKGFETAPEGSQLGAPGSVESRIRLWNFPLADGITFVDDQFVKYRTGAPNRPLKRTKIAIQDQLSTPTDLTYTQFKHEVAKAMRRADEHEIPEVAAAAKKLRKDVFEPLKDEAVKAGLLPEGVDVDTALSYMMRVYNKEKIIKERSGTLESGRPSFKSQVVAHLRSEEETNAQVESVIRPLMDEHKSLKSKIANLEKRIERRSRTAEKTEARREELTRLNKFAFQRADKLSQPLDELRQRIDTVSEQIQEQLDKIEELTIQIRGERENIPGLIEIESRIQRLSRGLSGVNREAQLIDVVEATDEINQGIEALKDSVRPVLREMRAESRGLREGEDALKELEKKRAALGKEIKPFRKELIRLRKELRKEEKQKKPRAREGAVFETKIRGRGNTLADQASGRNAEIENLKLDLETRQSRLEQVQNEIEKHVLEFKGKTTSKAKSAVGSRQKAEIARFDETMTVPMLKGADKPVIKAARQILRRTSKTDADIAERADEIINRIIGSPDGRLPYDAHKGHLTGKGRASARGPMKAREFNIPDEMIEDFLENDIEFLSRVYVRTMASDVELAKRFGSVDMTDQLKEIDAFYNKAVDAAKTQKERAKLDRDRKRDNRDIAAMRDRLRGTYAVPENPEGIMYRVGAVVRSLNYLRLLGGMTISAIPDISRLVMTHGLTSVFRDGLVPLMRDFKAVKLSGLETKMAGTALDMILDSRTMQLADIMDNFGRLSKFERGVQAAANKFGVVSLMAPWNSGLKQFAGLLTQTNMLRDIEAIAKGTATTKQVERLAAGGISETNARRIAEQFKKHGEKRNGVWLAQTAEWDDGSREAIEAFRVALSRDVDRTIVTPGQDRPLWMSHPLGQVLGQFKSFAVASIQRTMISGLQQRDMGVLSGAAMAVALGGLVHIIKQKQIGRDVKLESDEDWKQFIVNAVDRSGLTGYVMDANAMMEKASRGAIGLSRITGKPVSRYAQRNLTGSLIGPTFGTVQDMLTLTGVAGAATTGDADLKPSDIRAMRRLMPYQNLFYLRQLFDTAQENVQAHLGVQ